MIVYENAEPRPEEKPESPPPVRPEKAGRKRRALGLLPLQTAICAAILAALLFLRALAPAAFGAVQSFLRQELARSVLISEDAV